MAVLFAILNPVNTVPPVNSVLPIVTGEDVAGSTLECSVGEWLNAEEYSYQWLADGVEIAGAASNTYVTLLDQVGDDISCEQTATNAAGSTSVESNSITLTEAAPEGDGSPVVAQPDVITLLNGASLNWTPTLLEGETVVWTSLDKPVGINLDENTGTITGTPSTGWYAFNITAINSDGSYTFRVDISVYTTSVTVNQTWLDANGTSGVPPWYFATANTRYVLDVDVVAKGTAFVIRANNITFDLNGHTITFDNATPIAITNNGFETVDSGDSDLAENWDFTNAPNAIRLADGEFLDNEFYGGTCSLEFTDTTGNEYIESEGTITLLANTEYSLSAMFQCGTYGDINEGIRGYVKLVGTGDETTRLLDAVQFAGEATSNGTTTTLIDTSLLSSSSINDSYVVFTSGDNAGESVQILSYSNSLKRITFKTALLNATGTGDEYYIAYTNFRGIQLFTTRFVTGGDDETYNIQVGFDGNAASAGSLYVDDIQVQLSRVWGIVMGLGNTSSFPGVTASGTGRMGVFNGTIVQGSDAAINSGGVSVNALGGGSVISSLNITINGADGTCILGSGFSTQSAYVRNNNLTNNNLTLTSRDNSTSCVIAGIGGHIHDNTITNGPHTGIQCLLTGVVTEIYRNTIALKTRYTNGNAIEANGGHQIYYNAINCGTGLYHARGIATKGINNAAKRTRIYGNTIVVQEAAGNQEYGGEVLGGSYGIQVENAKYVDVYGNHVTANAVDVKAACMRVNIDGGTAIDVKVWGNTLVAVSEDGTHHAHCWKLNGMTDTNLTFCDDNHCITNDGIAVSNLSNLTMTNTEIEITTLIGSPIEFETNRLSNNELHFVDTTFADAPSEAYFEGATVWDDQATPAAHTLSFIDSAWTTTVHVKDGSNVPQVGAAVTIDNVAAAEVFSGTTDASGNCVATVKEFKMLGATATNYNNHSIFAVSGLLDGSVALTADQEQTVQVTVI